MQLEKVEDTVNVIERDQVQVLLIFEENPLYLLKQLHIELMQVILLGEGHVIANHGEL